MTDSSYWFVNEPGKAAVASPGAISSTGFIGNDRI